MRILLVGDEQRIAPDLAEAVTDNIAFDLLELVAIIRALFVCVCLSPISLILIKVRSIFVNTSVDA